VDIISRKIFWCLEGDKLANGKPISAFLDHYCLNEGEDWQNGFLNGLNYASLLVLLVQEDLLENIKHNSTKWQDNVLLEYEAALAKRELGECMILPMWVGKYVREEARGVDPLTKPYNSFDASAFPDGAHALADGSKGKNVRETMTKLFAMKEDGIFLDPENFHIAVPAIRLKAEEAEAAKSAWRLKQQALSNSAWVVVGSRLYNVDLANCTAELVSRRVRDDTHLVAGEEETLMLAGEDGSLHVAGRQNTGKSSNIPQWDEPLEIGHLKAAASNSSLGLLYDVNDDESSRLLFVKLKDGSEQVEVKDDNLPNSISHVAHVRGNTFAVFGSTIALVSLEGGAVVVTPFANTWNTMQIQAAAVIKDDAYFVSGAGTLWMLPLVKGANAKQKGMTGLHEGTHLLLVWNNTLVGFSQNVNVIDLECGSVEMRFDPDNTPDVDWTEASSAAMYKSQEEKKKR